MNDVMLRLTNVNLELGDGSETVHALDGVDLEVRSGEFVAVVGPSGAGKSSLLAVAGGLTTPTSRSVEVGGEDMTAPSRKRRTELRRRNIGFVFQSGNLIPALTARDQVRLPRTFGGKGERRRTAEELLSSVGMSHKADRLPGQLSGGERQRVGIARALSTDPKVLLVDEPTAALDRARSHEVAELLAAEAKENSVGVVMVTHDHDILRHCDTVYEMVDGRLTRHE